MPKTFLFLYNKIYPFIGFPLLSWHWYQATNLGFALFVLGLPLVYGYFVPGIGTNVLKLWRFFDKRWLVGNYFIHHGFIYASTLALALVITFTPYRQPLFVSFWEFGVWNLLLNMARAAGLVGFVGWFHDTVALREGMLEMYNTPWKQGASPEAVAFHYGPLVFSITGASYAGFAVLAYEFIVRQGDFNSLFWLIPLAIAVMSVAVSVPYLILEKRENKKSDK